jgi:GntR family transcriptional regulator
MTGGSIPPLKHERIAKVLEGEIRRGNMPTGRRLPGETALAERFSVSRNTVRAALSELGEAGLISTRSGKGSFVTYDGKPLEVGLGWARALKDRGVATSVTVLNLDEVDDPELAAELGQTSPRFVVIDRLRSVETGIISYERSRIPAVPAVSDAVAKGLAGGSLTQLLRGAGLIAAQGEQWVEIHSLTAEDARLLERKEGDVFLWSRCVTRDAAGALVENVESLLAPEHFRLHFQFANRSL